MFSCGDVLTISGLRRFAPDDSFFNPTLHIGLPRCHPFRIFVVHPDELGESDLKSRIFITVGHRPAESHPMSSTA
jgi:hypothetical protein